MFRLRLEATGRPGHAEGFEVGDVAGHYRVMPCSSAVAAVSASRSGRGSGTCSGRHAEQVGLPSAHHVISESTDALCDIGGTILNVLEPGDRSRPSYCEAAGGDDWSARSGHAMPSNVAVVTWALEDNPVWANG